MLKSLVALLIISCICCSCSDTVTIKHDEEGVMNKPYEGGIDPDKVYTEGTYEIEAPNEMYIYNVGKQSKEFTFNVLERDGKAVVAELEVMYAVQKGKAGNLHLEVGRNYKMIIDDHVKGVVKDFVGRYDIEGLKNKSDSFIEKEIEQYLVHGLERNYIDIIGVNLIKLTLVE